MKPTFLESNNSIKMEKIGKFYLQAKQEDKIFKKIFVKNMKNI